jgi:hypothetical protein
MEEAMGIRGMSGALITSAIFVVAGCRGADGTKGADGTSCTIVTNTNGTRKVSCEDGTEAVVADGKPGTSRTASRARRARRPRTRMAR